MNQHAHVKSKNSMMAWVVSLVIVIIGIGGWYIASQKTANDNANANQAISNQNKNTSLGTITKYTDPSGRFEIPLTAGWAEKVEDNTTTFTYSAQEITLRFESKDPSEALLAYVESHTTKAPVGEGTYEPLVSETINGLSCIKVIGTYVGPFTYDYCELSDSDILVLGGSVPTDQALATVRGVILGVKKLP